MPSVVADASSTLNIRRLRREGPEFKAADTVTPSLEKLGRAYHQLNS